jgi:hypothetical protein
MAMRRRHFVHHFLFVSLLAACGSSLAQSTTATFDDPPPAGSSEGYLNGIYKGIDFGTSQWRWTAPFASDPTRSIYFASSSGTTRSFSFVSGASVLSNLSVYTTETGTLTVSDGVNPTLTRTIAPGAMVQIATGWTAAAPVITVGFSRGWALGVDDLVYRTASPPPPDTAAPTVSMTSPADRATVSGTVSLSATASDDVAVAGVQFLVDGAAYGTEDTSSPYSTAWISTDTNNGSHSIAARARDAAGNVTTSTPFTVTVNNQAPAGPGYALRFYGNGRNDIDRVKIRVDDPATISAGPPVDVGSTSFTIEFWLRGTRADNRAAAVNCGAGHGWIYGNVVVDRDRYAQGRKYGISLGAGRVAFGVTAQDSVTICGNRDVLDGAWHHVAVQRRRSDGWLSIYVDGSLDAQGDGPDGDISYPDDGVPLNRCGSGGGQSCSNSDPFIVLGAEKHDVSSAFPSYNGFLDELRISTVLRYSSAFTRPGGAFVTDASTVGLYHFDEGEGSTAYDTSDAPSGPSNGLLRYGGSPAGPVWSTETPFATGSN